MITEEQASAEFARARTLAKLAPYLSEAEQLTTLAIARALTETGARVRALSSLAVRLPARQRGAVLQEALTSARQIGSLWLRVRAYAPIAMRLPAEEKSVVAYEMLRAIASIQNEWQRGRALGLLANIAPPEVKARAVEVAGTIGRPDVRALALSAYAGQLTSEQISEVQEAAPLVVDEWLRASMLTAVALHMSPDYFQPILAEVRQLQDHAARVVALNDLAHTAPEQEQLALRLEALTLARRIEEPGARAEMLLMLWETLPIAQRAGVAEEALAALHAVPDEPLRVSLLTDWLHAAPAELKDEVTAEALTGARQIADRDSRAEALSGFLEHANADQQAALKDEVLRLLA